MKKNHKKKVGFTIIEALVSIFIASSLLFGVFGLRYILNEDRVFIINSYMLTQDANRALNEINTYIRNAQYSETGAYPIENASDTSLTFFSDINGDGFIDRVRYFIEDSNLKRGVIYPQGIPPSYPTENEMIKVLAENISNTEALFTYYNESWPEDTDNNPLTNPINLIDIHLIRIYIELNTQNVTQHSYTLEAYAQMRSIEYD